MEKSFAVSTEYLVLPICNEGEEGRLRLSVEGRIELDYGVSLASGPEDVDWYAFFSLARFRGKEVRVSASNCHSAWLRAGAAGRRHSRRRGLLPGTPASAVPLHLAHRLAERPQRPDLVPGRIPPVLPAQPDRPALGQHDLGTRGEP